ncbi:HigA family addiction module antitoxin [Terasakiella sp. A23]|uniref:HigA family addiction module antitoxin n=1 Tax=Terasakiella sp. FCG-A23 TaxID=3080561 RepID=UPI002953BD71|nr:HigA family addiction module antitoxin [Terasakiella sp. A23]MDV7341814.1 HigA family addiction module antitoxin [Terasakiella sp. A23]
MHPGEIIMEDFLKRLKLSVYRLAKELHVPVNRMTAVLNGESAIIVDSAMRLSKFFGITVEFWQRLQTRYDVSVAHDTDLSNIVPYNSKLDKTMDAARRVMTKDAEALKRLAK